MSRTISIAVLIGVIALLAVFFFQVMASFLIPMFLAAILCVIFEPLHRWILGKCRGRQKTSAMLTTTAVMMVVLVPMILLLVLAVLESREIVSRLDTNSIKEKAERVRSSFNLDMPHSAEFAKVEETLASLTGDTRSKDWQEKLIQLSQVREATDELKLKLSESPDADGNPVLNDANVELFEKYEAAWQSCQKNLAALASGDFSELTDDDENPSEDGPKADGEDKTEKTEETDESKKGPGLIESATKMLAGGDDDSLSPSMRAQIDFRSALDETSNAYRDFKNQILGGRYWATIRELANPSQEEAEEYAQQVQSTVGNWLLSLGGATTSFLVTVVFGVCIMIVSMYFFLLDGPKMIEAIKFLSPMDDAHEDKLLDEFRKVSRAVVIATLLSAVVQGALAGVGYYFAGTGSIFLLTLLTTVFALVPFVGAGAIWFPACLWLYFIDGNPVSAICLGIYGFAIVSSADNVIKPFVLHGQSNIHPLLALLSVLGGVTALGPIGILVGPMIVVFLQTLLKILQKELSDLDEETTNGDEAKVEKASGEQVSGNQTDGELADKKVAESKSAKKKSAKSKRKRKNTDPEVGGSSE